MPHRGVLIEIDTTSNGYILVFLVCLFFFCCLFFSPIQDIFMESQVQASEIARLILSMKID